MVLKMSMSRAKQKLYTVTEVKSKAKVLRTSKMT